MSGLIKLKGADLTLVSDFISPANADLYFKHLQSETPWEQRDVVVQGRTYPQPRLVAWYGTGSYTYSGLKLDPLPLSPLLEELKQVVEAETGANFNSVLLNRYVAGRNHGIGFHSDSEPELGRQPLIAMLTFGEERALEFEPKPWIKDDKRKVPTPHGSLLVMAGDCQKNWKHGLPKKVGIRDRITLTFRTINQI